VWKRLALLVSIAVLAAAQTGPAFEAVSIKPDLSRSTNTQIQISGGRLTITNGSVKTLIRNAYGILPFQLAGEPRWLDNEMYDIAATTGEGGKISDEQFQPLLRNLLAEYFQLKVHWETREGSVYALIPDKGGARLQEGDAKQKPGINTRKGPGAARMVGTAEPIAILASNLGNQLGRFVLDKTGLKGVYNWTLEWDPDSTAESTHPSLFTAVQEQLGLRLEAQKGPMEVLVIDRVEKPSR